MAEAQAAQELLAAETVWSRILGLRKAREINVLLALQRPPRFWLWFVAGNVGLLWGLRQLTIDLGLI